MKIHTSLAKGGFEWGTPEATKNNTGHQGEVLLGLALFLGTVTYCAIWPDPFCNIVAFCIAIATLKTAFSRHFRTTAVQADGQGLRIAYSHVQEFLGDYVNDKATLQWDEITYITERDDGGEGTYLIGIGLRRPLLHKHW